MLEHELLDAWGDSRPVIVMISGHAGVGKSTLAGFLNDVAKEHDPEVKSMTMPIALGVKAVAKLMDWDGEKDIAGRQLLQKVGQVGRAYNPDVWIAKTITGIANANSHLQGKLDYAWVDDWRFKNEIAYVNANAFLFREIYTVRIEAPNREVLAGTLEALDISEIDLDYYDDFNITIDNSGSLEMLKMAARLIYNVINGG
jgi:energy-coupling factor transporter ATP-binding protein EcfA2